MKVRVIFEGIYRLVMATILYSLILIVGFVSLLYTLKEINERGLMNWRVQIGLIQASLAIAYLQIANIFYWIMDVNLFDFNKLFKEKEK